MVSRIRSAIVGALLLIGGGYAIGYASGAESLITQVTNAISSAAGSIPLFGSALATDLNNYVQSQLSTSYGTYYEAGIVLIVLGLGIMGWGMRTPKVSARTAAPVQPQTLAPSSVKTTTIKEASPPCRYCGASLGVAAAFCPACGRSTA